MAYAYISTLSRSCLVPVRRVLESGVHFARESNRERSHGWLPRLLHARQVCNRAVNVENLQGSEDMRGDLSTPCRIATLTQLWQAVQPLTCGHR